MQIHIRERKKLILYEFVKLSQNMILSFFVIPYPLGKSPTTIITVATFI